MILTIVLKYLEPVAAPVSAPVIFSVKEAPSRSVPTTLKDIPLSSPPDVITTVLAEPRVTAPPSAKAPPKTRAALLATCADAEKPFGSAATSSLIRLNLLLPY